MNATGKRRLLKLADMLEADAKDKKGIRFDLGVVGYKTDVTVPDDNSKKFTPEISCGTTACAMGLAAISGAFKRAGLGYRIKISDSLSIDTTFKGRRVNYGDAAMRLFGVSLEEARFLFSPWNYPESKRQGAISERFVAKRIRKLVAGKIDI